MICPRCDGQGTIIKANIRHANKIIFVCDECEASWKQGQEITISQFEDFGTLMNRLGYKGLWSELINIKEDWDEKK